MVHEEVDINHSSIRIIAQEDAESSEDGTSYAGEEMVTVFEDEGEEVVIGMSSDTNPTEFLGDCMDTGAQRSVIGRRQAADYYEFMSLSFQLDAETHPHIYKLVERSYKGLGALKLRIPTELYHFILAKVEVVEIDLPLPLRLEFLTQYGMSVDVIRNMLLSENADGNYRSSEKVVVFAWNGPRNSCTPLQNCERCTSISFTQSLKYCTLSSSVRIEPTVHLKTCTSWKTFHAAVTCVNG